MDFLSGASIENIASRKDKTWKLVIGTQELTPEQIASLGRINQTFGYVAFKIEPFTSKEKETIDEIKAEYEDKGKSQSQRLRGVLYYNFEKDPEGFSDFTTYYDSKMEKLIGHFKSKLDK